MEKVDSFSVHIMSVAYKFPCCCCHRFSGPCFQLGRSSKIQRSIEQHYDIKFCVRLGKSAMKTLVMIQRVSGSANLSKVAVLRCHNALNTIEKVRKTNSGKDAHPLAETRTIYTYVEFILVIKCSNYIRIRRNKKMTVQLYTSSIPRICNIYAELSQKVLTINENQKPFACLRRSFAVHSNRLSIVAQCD